MTWALAASTARAAVAFSAAARPGGGSAAASANPWGLLAAAALVAAGWWAYHAWRHPYGPCPRCQGGGRNSGSTPKRFGNCGRCGGTGRRIRIGAGLLHRLLRQARK